MPGNKIQIPNVYTSIRNKVRISLISSMFSYGQIAVTDNYP